MSALSGKVSWRPEWYKKENMQKIKRYRDIRIKQMRRKAGKRQGERIKKSIRPCKPF